MTLTADQLTPRISADLLRSLEARADVVNGGAEQIPVFAPSSGARIGTIPQAGDDDVARAVDRSRRAQEDWKRLSPTTRGRVFTRFHDLLIDSADQAMDLVQLEAGKARIPAFEEIYDTVATTRYYVNTAPKLLKRRRRAVSFPGVTRAYEYRQPHGVVGFISPGTSLSRSGSPMRFRPCSPAMARCSSPMRRPLTPPCSQPRF